MQCHACNNIGPRGYLGQTRNYLTWVSIISIHLAAAMATNEQFWFYNYNITFTKRAREVQIETKTNGIAVGRRCGSDLSDAALLRTGLLIERNCDRNKMFLWHEWKRLNEKPVTGEEVAHPSRLRNKLDLPYDIVKKSSRNNITHLDLRSYCLLKRKKGRQGLSYHIVDEET